MGTAIDKNANVLAGFHPAIVRWFNSRFASPSAPQVKGWPAIKSGKHTLIAAPTGSGKTLAAFMSCIDSLLRQALDGTLAPGTQVVYVSPLKALSNDVQKNLAQPLQEIGQALEGMGLPVPEIRVLVRTGDTPSSQRQAMAKNPPHILVTTPESLYLLLTSERGRNSLQTVRTVIVDEIHAVAGSKRGSHMALSLERLEALTKDPPVRVGLSATQKPLDEIACLLVGNKNLDAAGKPKCVIVDQGYRRHIDLAVELPGAPLSAVASADTWEEIYERLAELISNERTTLVFVNTRRLAERLTFHLAKRVGEANITSHHGSLSREMRLEAEERLKAGELKALVATASLELGIDIGTVDLVCQLGATHSIATLLQRVGRSGHNLGAVPRGRIFPLTRDDLVECAALLGQVCQGNLDRIIIPKNSLDILAQQIVATVSTGDWDEDALFQLCRRAYPYRNLTRQEFDDVCRMLSQGFSTRRGRGAAYLHHDAVNRRFRPRKGARLAAVTSGGAIPDNADYDVILEPQDTRVGSVNEDFAIESMPGDIFQLGISSWRILKVDPGKVRVEDAHGLPPSIPFWLGEAPARTVELSSAVSRLRHEVGERLPDQARAVEWLRQETGIDVVAAQQIAEYIAAGKSVLGVVPTQQTIVLERFFDESGGMQLVLHSVFGSRINKAWGLALRKRFCRTFNFELQAAATDDAIVLSLGMQHSFPLEDVFSFLHPNTARDVLVQAMLPAPVFQTRWRWDATRALALLRQQGGKKAPVALQRMRAEDLLAAVFPHVLACPENLAGDIELPDHPLVNETIKDCLTEAMDVDGFLLVLDDMVEKRVELVARDATEPSPFAHEILTAKPYAFLDDAPLEERRTQAVYMRRTLDAESAQTFGKLDAEAIQRVRQQAWPDVESADELHDALLVLGFLTETEGASWQDHFDRLMTDKRATRLLIPPLPCEERGQGSGPLETGPSAPLFRKGDTEGLPLWVAAERLPMFHAVFPELTPEPHIAIPERDARTVWLREDALRELIRGRLEALGPVSTRAVAASAGVETQDALEALYTLEAEGFGIRGHFTSDGYSHSARPEATEGQPISSDGNGYTADHISLATAGIHATSTNADEDTEWCDRRLLARIHRYTLDRLRQEIEPVSAADFLRFLMRWHHIEPEFRLDGPTGLVGVLESLEGFEIPAVAWEQDILPSRLSHYSTTWLDQLCLSGDLVWARLHQPDWSNGRKATPARLAPVALLFRGNLDIALSLSPVGAMLASPSSPSVVGKGTGARFLSGVASQILEYLQQRGACFLQDIVRTSRQLPSKVEAGLAELVSHGLITCDGFAGLRSLASPAKHRTADYRRNDHRHSQLKTLPGRGQWSAISGQQRRPSPGWPNSTAGQTRVGAYGIRPLPPQNLASGRWTILHHPPEDAFDPSQQSEFIARQLLRRYGVVFHKLLVREPGLPPWRDLLRAYRRLEARGEVRGGRFVDRFSGEQYALPEAVQQIRAIRRKKPDGALVTVNGADPLNLVGILTPGQKVPSLSTNRILYRDGVPVAVKIGGEVTYLAEKVDQWELPADMAAGR